MWRRPVKTGRKMDTKSLRERHVVDSDAPVSEKYRGKTVNTAVSETTGLLNDLPLIIADRRHILFGHICQLSPEAPAHRVLQLCIE